MSPLGDDVDSAMTAPWPLCLKSDHDSDIPDGEFRAKSAEQFQHGISHSMTFDDLSARRPLPLKLSM